MKKYISGIAHVGITVLDYDRAKQFYESVLGLLFKGEMVMEGQATDTLFGIAGCKVKVAYYNGSEEMAAPPIELLYFEGMEVEKVEGCLMRSSISEVCFHAKGIDEIYRELKDKGVNFLSEPQFFDLTSQGFGKSKAVYFRDSEGNILELIEEMK